MEIFSSHRNRRRSDNLEVSILAIVPGSTNRKLFRARTPVLDSFRVAETQTLTLPEERAPRSTLACARSAHSCARSGSIFDRRGWVVLPDVLKCFEERLLFYRSVNVSCVAGKYELVVIALGREYAIHMLAGENPIVHIVAHHVRI